MVQLNAKLSVRVVDDKCDSMGCKKGSEYPVVGCILDSLSRTKDDGKKIEHSSMMVLIINDSGDLKQLYPSAGRFRIV